jgi:hypothetical protein
MPVSEPRVILAFPIAHAHHSVNIAAVRIAPSLFNSPHTLSMVPSTIWPRKSTTQTLANAVIKSGVVMLLIGYQVGP